MEKIKNLFSGKFFKIFKWIFLILLILYLIIVAVRVFQMFGDDKTNAQVEKIHMTKLQLSDVMGDNLPPDPGSEADKTIEGIDANENGIRDDVELAIFEEYPDSAKTRAVLLQYALALQMEVTQPFVNTEIVTEIITEQSRADTCVADTLVPRESSESSRPYSDVEKINTFIKFIEDKQFNTEERKVEHKDFMKNLRSFGDSTNKICDIDINKL